MDWKQIAEEVYEEVKNKIKNQGLKLNLKVILVWNNPNSIRYINQKRKWAEFCWINFELINLGENISQEDLIKKVKELNVDKNTTWYLVQMPLPSHIDEKEVIKNINPLKDVDWFHPENYWNVAIWEEGLKPCTPFWVMEILNKYWVETKWKNAVVIGRSNIVWKPMALMLINSGATVTVCNSMTKNLNFFTKNADIIISAVWKPLLLTKEMIGEKTVIIDVWFTVIDWEIYWDADFKNITKAGNLITPVPGWVGPMTVAMIMKNLISSHKKQNG